ncbi:MAG TPA: hypothetical protein VFD90_01990 [Gaiellales bacterium]|jgi:hypothetical protein|nr:hypothetical protein [Gaiellales bacterium]
MPVDVPAAEQFLLSNARLLERHRMAVLLHGGAASPVLDALRAYRNADGGFGHALEPDVRGPESEPVATLAALEVLAEVGELDDPMVADAAAWIGGIADADGGVPFVMPATSLHPHAPWMVPTQGGSQLTFALAAVLTEADSDDPWLPRATEWCWRRIAHPEELHSYRVKFALAFLDAVPDEARATAAIEGLRSRIGPDGTMPVAGGTDDERLTPLGLSPQPGTRSRVLFTQQQIDADLDRLEDDQQADGGWTFDWLAWSEGQSVEWRGLVTLLSLASLADHGRIELPQASRQADS